MENVPDIYVEITCTRLHVPAMNVEILPTMFVEIVPAMYVEIVPVTLYL